MAITVTIPAITSKEFKQWMNQQVINHPEHACSFDDKDWYDIYLEGYREIKVHENHCTKDACKYGEPHCPVVKKNTTPTLVDFINNRMSELEIEYKRTLDPGYGAMINAFDEVLTFINDGPTKEEEKWTKKETENHIFSHLENRHTFETTWGVYRLKGGHLQEEDFKKIFDKVKDDNFDEEMENLLS